MNKSKENIIKVCNFYISEWHLVMMLLPYIKDNINNNIVTTFLEKNVEENVKVLLSKINVSDEIKEKIEKINWKCCEKINDINLASIINNEKNKLIIISGSMEYVDKINKELMNKNLNNVKIVNCYKVDKNNKNIKNVLINHDKILNTSGEKEIVEVFGEYKKHRKVL